MAIRWSMVLATFVAAASGSTAQDGTRQTLQYAPAAVDNPLKGLVPYAGIWKDRFPHSMEFDYLPLSALVVGYDRYDWKPLEKLLNACADRGHQVVFRVYLEYPDKRDGIPPFLLEDGLKVTEYKNDLAKPPEKNVTPDYSDVRLRKVLAQFVAAFGRKYDGDPRIGFITAGLLGHWGEWHTWPRDDLFASRTVQAEVMDAYEAAFRITPVLLRYPIGPKHESAAPNAARGFGYHDDSFAWATLDTGKKDDSWFYMAAARAAGRDALDKWKTRPIGGEIRPEAWGRVFDAEPGKKEIQNFRRCVEETHASWLMDTGMFETKRVPARIESASTEVRRMGYEFHFAAATIGAVGNRKRPVVVEIENRGVAPFYYDWPIELALIADGKVVKSVRGAGKVTGLLPGDKPRIWEESPDFAGVAVGKYRLAIRVANPLPKGQPIRFANRTQDADATGWLTFGDFEIR